jgi:hypothetical protein
MNIDITDLDKAAILLALYNNAKFQGSKFSVRNFFKKWKTNIPPATLESAQDEIFLWNINGKPFFDYVDLGSSKKPLKVDLSGSSFDPTKYNAYHGECLAENVILSLRLKHEAEKKKEPIPEPVIEEKPPTHLIISSIQSNELFKTDYVGKCIIEGDIGDGATVDCRQSELIVMGNRGRNVTIHSLGEPTFHGRRGNDVTMYIYDETGKSRMKGIGIDGSYYGGGSIRNTGPSAQLEEFLESGSKSLRR